MDYQIPENQVHEPDMIEHVQEEGVEENYQNHKCPECEENFKTKCDIRIHVGR